MANLKAVTGGTLAVMSIRLPPWRDKSHRQGSVGLLRCREPLLICYEGGAHV